MQTENRNMQTHCSTIIAKQLLIRENFILIFYSGACSLCDVNPSKKREVQVVLRYTLGGGFIYE